MKNQKKDYTLPLIVFIILIAMLASSCGAGQCGKMKKYRKYSSTIIIASPETQIYRV